MRCYLCQPGRNRQDRCGPPGSPICLCGLSHRIEQKISPRASRRQPRCGKAYLCFKHGSRLDDVEWSCQSGGDTSSDHSTHCGLVRKGLPFVGKVILGKSRLQGFVERELNSCKGYLLRIRQTVDVSSNLEEQTIKLPTSLAKVIPNPR